MYDALQAGETLSGEKVSPDYINSLHTAVTNVLELAVEEGIIPFNPARKARPPKIVRNERRGLTPQQARGFVSKLDPGNAHHCAYPPRGIARTQARRGVRPVLVRYRPREPDGPCAPQPGRLWEPEGAQDQGGHPHAPHERQGLRGTQHPKKVQAELLDTWHRASLGDDPCSDGQTPDSPVISNRDGTRISPNSLARW